ncbi:MAG: hypothetical protein PHI77_00680 [Candidatus Pacebacteria bacterium]|nr:hypothetical protein [Candidatus Paceibacterota bacterium]MDD4830822.1 hypothetical protein [Candidatus Paceibacterota bacterium]MDD4874903.1 hypothetical protein [Candidatus Paceibacterota bacterium]
MAEEIKTEAEEGSKGNFLAFTTPEGMVMMTSAVMVDVSGFFGFPWLFIPDLFFGFWLMMRGSVKSAENGQEPVKKQERGQEKNKKPSAPPKAGKRAKKVRRIKWLRVVVFIGELIPVINILPLWIILVFSELFYNS